MPTTVDLTEKTINRILIIKWSALGDLAIASAIFEDIRNAFPDARIDLNTLPAWKSLFEHDRRFDRLITVDVRKKGRKLRGAWEWLKQVSRNRYDLVVDLQSNDRSRMLLTLLGLGPGRIRYRIGNNQQFPYNIRPLQNIRNTFRRCQSALQAGGIPARTMIPVLSVPADSQDRVEQLRRHHGLRPGRYAVFFPGSQAEGYLKRWGADNYAALAKLLTAHGVEKSVLVGAADEMDECLKIVQADDRDCIVNLCGQTRILDIIPLCSQARCIVANDTGTARIAAATDKPLLMLFGPTNPERDTPGGAHVAALQLSEQELPCIKCFRKTCDHHSCMKLLNPERVLQRLLAIPE